MFVVFCFDVVWFVDFDEWIVKVYVEIVGEVWVNSCWWNLGIGCVFVMGWGVFEFFVIVMFFFFCVVCIFMCVRDW